jgi:hypothetical protein
MAEDLTTELVPYVYQVDGTSPPLLIGINTKGSILIGEPSLSAEPVRWLGRISTPGGEGVEAFQRVLEQARVTQREVVLDRLAAEYVTDEMVATATAAFQREVDLGDVPLRIAIMEALSATPLGGPFTTDQMISAYRRAEREQPGTGIRAGLRAVARSRIADGSIKP